MTNLDQWLITESEQECVRLVRRLKKAFPSVKKDIGVPLQLKSGKWVQCVGGFEQALTPEEKEAVVSIETFQKEILVR